MVNRISERANVKIHGKIARKVWARLWYICRAIDKEGSGRVKILVSKMLKVLKISRATFYRWLKEGKAAGAFQSYKRIDKDIQLIQLGSKVNVCKKLGITDWDSSTEIPIWKLFNNPELSLWNSMGIKPNRVKLKKLVTSLQAYWMQHQSIEAAKEAEKKRTRSKRNRHKPYVPDFGGADGKPTSQLSAARNYRFSRKHIPTGASQKGIGKSLRVSDRTARRHLEGTERVQIFYKEEAYQAQAELFYARETGAKSPVFKRNGEYYRYGTNLYNLNFQLCSEFTQRLKYKFQLLLEEIPLEAIHWEENKYKFCSPLFSSGYMTKHEILEKLKEKYELDSLDQILIPIYWELKTRSFEKFRIAVRKELRRLRAEEYKRARSG